VFKNLVLNSVATVIGLADVTSVSHDCMMWDETHSTVYRHLCLRLTELLCVKHSYADLPQFSASGIDCLIK